MSLLLTDEEIRAVANEVIRYVNSEKPIGRDIERRAVAKAQLKKVVEYIKNKAEIDCGYGDAHTGEMVLIQMLEKEWQALLEEVK